MAIEVLSVPGCPGAEGALSMAQEVGTALAPGIDVRDARFLAPPGVTVSPAGSAPAFVRPQAIQVLKEIGIDISAHRSKATDEIDSASVSEEAGESSAGGSCCSSGLPTVKSQGE